MVSKLPRKEGRTDLALSHFTVTSLLKVGSWQPWLHQEKLTRACLLDKYTYMRRSEQTKPKTLYLAILTYTITDREKTLRSYALMIFSCYGNGNHICGGCWLSYFFAKCWEDKSKRGLWQHLTCYKDCYPCLSSLFEGQEVWLCWAGWESSCEWHLRCSAICPKEMARKHWYQNRKCTFII